MTNAIFFRWDKFFQNKKSFEITSTSELGLNGGFYCKSPEWLYSVNCARAGQGLLEKPGFSGSDPFCCEIDKILFFLTFFR